MPLLKRYHNSIQRSDWEKFNSIGDPQEESPSMLGCRLTILVKFPGKDESAKGYFVRATVPEDASDEYKAAAIEFAKHKLIHDCDIKTGPKHVAFLASKRRLITTDGFPDAKVTA